MREQKREDSGGRLAWYAGWGFAWLMVSLAALFIPGGKETLKNAGRGREKVRRANRQESMALILLFGRFLIWVMVILLLLFFTLLALYSVPSIRPISTLMIKDEVLRRDYQRQWVTLEDVSPHLVNAVLMSEDGRFCRHYGVDWQALQSEIMRDGGPSRGASTISMQVVKNLFLWHSPPFARHWSDAPLTYLRKGLEIPLSLMVDTVWSKKRIMEIYLNIAEWGSGIYGVEAAAHYYFNRPAARLTPRQGALLAVALPNPRLRNPARPTEDLNRLARLAQNRAARSGAYIGCLK